MKSFETVTGIEKCVLAIVKNCKQLNGVESFNESI